MATPFERANGDKRTMTQLSCSVIGIGSWVLSDALSESSAMPLGYAVAKEEQVCCAMLAALQRGLEGLPSASFRLEGASGTSGWVARFQLSVLIPGGAC